ncbi:MAG TPA: DUF1844 domain-containing protein [bacterium]|nr:DUF1844 domain-containing protein [bacterium]HPP08351.1 DUF1844 domain-containing protein [bacterium]HXK45681.1 DUF1844 domain-containing protein [bacterium]
MEKTDFIELLHFLHILCWQALGKMANPVSGKPERNLQFAKRLIDILETLQVKTKGNLEEDETRMLEDILTDLRLNYVDELNKESKEKESGGHSQVQDERKTEDQNKGNT